MFLPMAMTFTVIGFLLLLGIEMSVAYTLGFI